MSVVVVAGLIAGVVVDVSGQEDEFGQISVITVSTKDVGPEIGRAVVVTALRDGVAVKQGSSKVNDPRRINPHYVPLKELEPGRYEVRVEGEGLKTVVKRGIVVTAGDDTLLRVEVDAGAGCKVITYSVAELADLGKACPDEQAHLDAPPDQWESCPVCGEDLE